MLKVKVYRSGIVAVPVERGCEAELYAQADAFCPAGRQARTTGIFAAPTLPGVTRWVRGNALVNSPDIAVRELTVDAESVYVYSVRAWELASSYNGREARMRAYWDSGVKLSDWMKLDLDGKEWEILLSPADVLTVRPVSAKRVVASEPDDFTAQAMARDLKARPRTAT